MCFSDFGNKSTKEIYIKSTPSTNKIPTSVKKKSTVINKTTAKAKKFVPPTKPIHKAEQKKQECINNIQEASSRNTLNDTTSKSTTSEETTNSLLQASNIMNIDLYEQLQCTQEQTVIQYDNFNNDFPNMSTFSAKFVENPANFNYLSVNSGIGNTEDNSIIPLGGTERKPTPHIAGLILGSLNVLNDDEFLFSQNLSQETQSDQSSVKNLSRVQSLCSVTSLKKIYKNLDVKSFENEPRNEDKKLPVPLKDYKIPDGDEYLKLFKNKPAKKKSRKYPPMSIEFGDMGFNKNYSDYIKDVGFVPEEMKNEENDTFMKILEMYPKENEIFIKMKFPK